MSPVHAALIYLQMQQTKLPHVFVREPAPCCEIMHPVLGRNAHLLGMLHLSFVTKIPRYQIKAEVERRRSAARAVRTAELVLAGKQRSVSQ